jgi:Holliday junction resolvase-like predicted endonuclease
VNRKEKGYLAEQFCQDFLFSLGYQPWKSNYRVGNKEADLIFTFKHEWVLVEVKAMQALDYIPLQEAQKENYYFIGQHLQEIHPYPLRFDLFLFQLNSSFSIYEHIIDAF